VRNDASNTKHKSMKRKLAGLLGALALLWVLACGAIYATMWQPPETFARVMARVPGPVAFLVFPFETLWTHARAGALQVGSLAPDFSLTKLDKSSQLQLVEAAGVEPASENVTGPKTTCLVGFMPQALPWDVRGRRSEPTRNASR
jgi:hypothetical protein